MSRRRPFLYAGMLKGEIAVTRNGKAQARPLCTAYSRVVEYSSDETRKSWKSVSPAWQMFAEDILDGVFDGCPIEAVNLSFDTASNEGGTTYIYVHFTDPIEGDAPTWGTA